MNSDNSLERDANKCQRHLRPKGHGPGFFRGWERKKAQEHLQQGGSANSALHWEGAPVPALLLFLGLLFPEPGGMQRGECKGFGVKRAVGPNASALSSSDKILDNYTYTISFLLKWDHGWKGLEWFSAMQICFINLSFFHLPICLYRWENGCIYVSKEWNRLYD